MYGTRPQKQVYTYEEGENGANNDVSKRAAAEKARKNERKEKKKKRREEKNTSVGFPPRAHPTDREALGGRPMEQSRPEVAWSRQARHGVAHARSMACGCWSSGS